MSSRLVKSSVLHGVKDLRLEQRQLPIPEPDDVQIAVRSTGLCGSDLHYYNHFRNGDIMVREPLTLGHESSGTVVAVGSRVTTLAVGDNVALEVGQPCEACGYCTSGRYNLCKQMKFRSSAKSFPHAQGTLQELVNHPARWCHKLPEGISLDLGAIVEPLSVALHAYHRAGPLPRKPTILVLGAGAVGLLVAAVARAYRAEAKMIIADVQASRNEFAIRHKFADKAVLVPMERQQTTEEKLEYARKVADLVETANGSEGQVDAVFECTGVETCLQTAIYATKPGGKVLIIGMGTPIVTLPISTAALREVDLVGVFRYANTYPQAIELLLNPPTSMPDVKSIVTHRFQGMKQVLSAFELAGKPQDENGNLVIKVIVDLAQ